MDGAGINIASEEAAKAVSAAAEELEKENQQTLTMEEFVALAKSEYGLPDDMTNEDVLKFVQEQSRNPYQVIDEFATILARCAGALNFDGSDETVKNVRLAIREYLCGCYCDDFCNFFGNFRKAVKIVQEEIDRADKRIKDGQPIVAKHKHQNV